MGSQKKINNAIAKVVKFAVSKSINRAANSTGSMIYYQPKAPRDLKKFSRVENDK